MLTCPKCGELLVPGSKGLSCVKCNYKDRSDKRVEIKGIISKTREGEGAGGKDIQTEEVAIAKCPKCGHERAYHWSVQTRAADEPETEFYRCVKCKHTWRER